MISTAQLKQANACRTPNVTKLPVLEDDELLSPCNLSQPSDSPIREVLNDVCVSFEHADLVSHILGQLQQLGGACYIC